MLGKAALTPGVTDEQLFKLVADTLKTVAGRLASNQKGKTKFKNNLWRRETIRYDAPGSYLRAHNLTLAVEATDEMTKLTCRKHNFIPELLFNKTKKSLCFPDIAAKNVMKSHEIKHKLEQDLHFSDHKYCASGSLFIPGSMTNIQTLKFFSRYFPKLETLLPSQTPLQAASHWDEAVFDNMLVSLDKVEIATWMLVNRWEWGSNTLLESELSFKIEKAMKDDWDYHELHSANQLYLELQKTGVFLPAPPIFLYQDPVASVNIILVN